MSYCAEIYDGERQTSIRSKVKGNPNFQLIAEYGTADNLEITHIYEEKSLEKHEKIRIPFDSPVLQIKPAMNENGRYLRSDLVSKMGTPVNLVTLFSYIDTEHLDKEILAPVYSL